MNNSDPPRRVELSWFMLFLHWLVRVDPEILSGCPTIDRHQMISKAVLLSAVGVVALFAWGAFFLQFWPLYVAVPLTLVVVIIIVMIDQFLGSSRWFLQGVLRVPGGTARGELLSAVLILRLVVAGVVSYATSTSAMMSMSAATIQAEQQKTRDAENAAKRAAGATEKVQTRQIMLGALDAEVERTTAEADAVTDKLDAARRMRDAAGQQLIDNKIKADCQLTCRRSQSSGLVLANRADSCSN